MGETLLLSPEGVVTWVGAVMVDGKYTLDGNQLALYADATRAGPPDNVQTLAFAGDTALISVGANSKKLIPFEARAKPNSLLGQWRYIHNTGVPAYEEYTTEGTMRFRLPVEVRKGLYLVRDNTIRMRFFSPRTEELGAPFTLKGDTLIFRMGMDTLYIRARRLLPNDLQQPAPPNR